MNMLIAIEGIDGTGKTTQAKILAEDTSNSLLTCQPTRESPFGKRIREGSVPPEEELAVFIADRQWHLDNVIQPALDVGKTVITDRYTISCAAYQGGQIMKQLGVSQDEALRIIAERHAHLRRPDILIVLDQPVEVSLARIDARGPRSSYETVEFLEQARELYKAATNIRELRGRRTYIINADRLPVDVTDAIKLIVGSTGFGPDYADYLKTCLSDSVALVGASS